MFLTCFFIFIRFCRTIFGYGSHGPGCMLVMSFLKGEQMRFGPLPLIWLASENNSWWFLNVTPLEQMHTVNGFVTTPQKPSNRP